MAEDAQERDIERALTRHITQFLRELGAGFAFVGRQYRLGVGGDEFFVDLLFYHLTLRCYVVVELKMRSDGCSARSAKEARTRAYDIYAVPSDRSGRSSASI